MIPFTKLKDSNHILTFNIHRKIHQCKKGFSLAWTPFYFLLKLSISSHHLKLVVGDVESSIRKKIKIERSLDSTMSLSKMRKNEEKRVSNSMILIKTFNKILIIVIKQVVLHYHHNTLIK